MERWLHSAKSYRNRLADTFHYAGAGRILLQSTCFLILAAAIASLAFAQGSAGVPVKPLKRVLIFNDFEPMSSPGVARIDQAIFAGLSESPYQIELYSENLQAILFPDEASQKRFRDWYIRKYQDRKPDVIITVGPASLKFLIESHEKSFPGTPIIFCGTTEEMLDQLKLDFNFTGVWGVPQPEKTLEVALRLQPGTKHIVVVGGVGAFDRTLEAITKRDLHKYESRFEFTYLTDLDMPTLLKRLRHLPDNTIVYHTSIMQDAAGTHFIDATQAVPMVASAANAPVFVMDEVDLNSGTVGGDLVSWDAIGRTAATMAVSALRGERPRDIPIVRNANVYMFDWRALRRWGLSESALPPGSIVLNRQPSIWESYKYYILGSIFLILVETLLIFGLVWQRLRRRKVEAELAITYDRLRLAVEAGKAVGWEFDIKSGRNRWFGDLQTMFGIPSDIYDGQVGDFLGRVHVEDREHVSKAIADAKQDRKRYFAEFRVIRDDQTVRWITARGQFYYAKNGDPERMLGMAVDITERKQFEQTLQRTERELLEAQHLVQVGSWQWDIASGNFSWSEEPYRIHGLDPGVAPPPYKDLPVLFTRDSWERLHAVMTEALGTGSVRELDLELVRPDGSKRWITTRGKLVRDAAGRVTSLHGTVQDITDRKRMSEELRESEERFRLVANSAPVLIWMSGPDKLCSYFNQPWLEFTGRALEEELGNGWSEGVHPEDLKMCLDTYVQAFDRRESFKMQYRLRRHDGEYRWVFDMGVPRFNSDGSFAGYIGSCIDVTERKLAEEALSSVNRRLIEAHEEERTRIARELHDDINQRVAMLAIEVEQLEHNPPKSVADLHRRVQEVHDHIADLGNDVQALSHRLHSSKLEYLGLVAGSRSFCREFSQQQKVEIEFRSDDDFPRYLPQETSICLFRVLQEALQNAVKHSGVRCCTVDLRAVSNEIRLTVSDSGVGFDSKAVENSRGLGLISMRERLKLVKGKLSIHSQPKSGTMIEARVPFVAEEHLVKAVG